MNMNFYVDFEATQPEQEIISIGVYSDNKESFYALVKPQFSKISKYITDMTGITNEMVEDRYDLDTAFNDLYVWCANQETNLNEWHFYSYGDGDVDFIKHSMCNIQTQRPLIIASIMVATMKDFSKDVTRYFHGTTSLIKAFNFLKDLEDKQKHNALEDAKMLADIFVKIYDKAPLAANPFVLQAREDEANYKFPSGRFFCKATGKNAKEREFPCVEAAIEWLIETNISKDAREKVHRDKMATKIMKAIRKHGTYMGYKWRRDKNTKIAFIGREDELHANNAIYYGTQVEIGHWILPKADGGFTYVRPTADYNDAEFIAIEGNKVNINGTNYDLVYGKEKN